MRIFTLLLTLFALIGSTLVSASVSHGNGGASGNWLKTSPATHTPTHPERNKTGIKSTIKPAGNTGYTTITPDGNIDFSLVGYATLTGGTTGGAGGNTITVTTGTELQAALTAKIKQTTPLTIYVAGKITPENSPGLTKIDIKDLKDVSLLGVGTIGEFDGIGIKIYKASNVIVRNVKVHHVRIGDKDCISIEGPAHHIWIDHCELYNEFQGVNKDYYDALLDAKAESEYITFSWNYLHDSWKASLAGSSESDTYDRKITYHHNYFRNLNSRLPLFRGGNGHVFNNYYQDVVETAINSRIGACLKIENNYFLNVNNPYVSAYSTVVGYGDISGNILVDSPFKYTTDEKELGPCTSNIPYTYAHALHTAEEVPSIVEQYAGVGVIDVFAGGGSEPQPQPVTYQLTTSVTGQGSVSPSGGIYAEGASVTLNATPATGWVFSGWSGGATGTANPLTISMTSNKTIAAAFTQTNTGGGDSGGGDGGGSTPSGPTVRIDNTATTATGLCSYDGSFRAVNSVNVINLSNSAGKGITWKVEVPSAGNYAMTWRYAGGGSSAAETAKLMVNGATVVESISFPKPAGSTSFMTTIPVTVILGNGVNEIRIETTVATAFADIEWIEITGNNPVATDCSNAIGSGGGGDPVPATYTLSATSNPSNGGTVTFSPEGGTYEEGTPVTVAATPAECWQFSGWSGDASGAANTAELTMSSNKSVVANFYQITSARIAATATPATGLCSFDGVIRITNDGTSVMNLANTAGKGVNWKVEVPAAGSYDLTWRYAGGGSAALETGTLIVNGAAVNASVSFPKPKDSQSFLTTTLEAVSLSNGVNEIRIEVPGTFADIEWLEVTGNGPVATGCSNAVGSGGGGVTVPATYTLSASSNPSNGGTVAFSPAGGTYNDGTQVNLTATPASGYSFAGWSGDASGTSATATLVMNGNKSVVAAFNLTNTDPDPNPGPAPSNAGMAGFATVSGEGYTTTTGGEGGQIITISTLAQLQTWAVSRENKTTPEIVYISGKIEAPSTTVVTIKHGANVSVIGIGSTAELMNVGLNFRNYKNVIVRNLKIHEVFYPNDALTIDECQHVWVDHNEFHSKIGAGIGVDTYDGLLDIKNGSRYVTVSWNYFHDHMKTVLIGHTDNTSAEATNRQIRVTFHHNYFENTDGRNPSLRWGAVHMYNNYLKNITDYGIAARQGAHALLENNVYENVKLPMSTNKFTGEGYICERGNLFTGTSGNNSITQTDCDWWNASTLPYAYTLEDASTIAATLPALVGVGKIDGTDGGGNSDPDPVTYQLATSVVGQGEVSTAGGTFNEGAEATITATPATGWQFSGWSGDASGTTNPLTIVMSSNKTIVATFTEITYELTTSATGRGSVSLTNGTHAAGTEVALTATPAAGWKFAGWMGDATGEANPTKVIMDGAKTIEATFTEIEYQLSASVVGQGSLSFVNSTYTHQRTVTLTATPATGWKFTGWSGDAQGETNPVTITMDADKSVTANFARIEYQLSVAVQGQGSVSLTEGSYKEGETVLVSATPAAGWQFDGWSGAASGTASMLAITMDTDKTVTANFSPRGGKGPVVPAAKETMASVYPNPFKSSTTFEFILTEKSKVKITLYAFDGVKVANVLAGNQSFEAGTHSILYTNVSLKPGIYVYVIETDYTVYKDQLVVE